MDLYFGVFCLSSDAAYACEYFLAFMSYRLEVRLKGAAAGNVIMTAQQFPVVAYRFALLTNFTYSCHRIFLL